MPFPPLLPRTSERERGTDPQRSEKCLDYHRSLLSGHFHSGLFIRQTIDADFVRPHETEILNIGISYLRIEGAFYCGIGILFLLYGYYRAIRMPGMSVVLTVVSLGTRVALSYWLAGIPAIGVIGIWWSIPIGWFIADVIGIIYYKYRKAPKQLNLNKCFC